MVRYCSCRVGDLLDLVLASDDLEGIIVSHDIDGSHVSSYFTANGTLA
jgi:hypothetical protein